MKILMIKKQSAFSLIEAVIALGLTVVVMTATISASRAAQQNARVTIAANEVQQLVDDGINLVTAYKKANLGNYNTLFGLANPGDEAYYIFYPKEIITDKCKQLDSSGGSCLTANSSSSDGGGASILGICKYTEVPSIVVTEIGDLTPNTCQNAKVAFKDGASYLSPGKMFTKVKQDSAFGKPGEMLALRNFSAKDNSQYFAISSLSPVNNNTPNNILDAEEFSLYYRSMMLKYEAVNSYTLTVKVQNKLDKRISLEKTIQLTD